MFILTSLNSVLTTDTWTMKVGVSTTESCLELELRALMNWVIYKCRLSFKKSPDEDQHIVKITALRGRFMPSDTDEVSTTT